MTDYPFKKKNKREFSDTDFLINLVQSFNLLIDEQNGNNNHSNFNVINNSVINSHWNSQSQNWSTKQQSKKEI